MTDDSFIFLFYLMIGFYVIAALSPIFLLKKQRVTNIVSSLLCSIAGMIGIVFSMIFIGSDISELNIINQATNMPYLNLDITIDGISAFFILALSILVLVVSIYSIGYMSKYYDKKTLGRFYFFYATFILSMVLVFSSGNMLIFLMSWEIMALTSYFLVVFDSEYKEVRKASSIYIIMTHIGTAFLFIAFIITYVKTGSFAIENVGDALSSNLKTILFVMYLIGFGTKAGIVPLHIWLPYAHPSAPSNVSALMSGIMIKTAIYGLIRFIFDVLGVENFWWGVTILLFGVITTFVGITYAYIVKNIKKLLAFSSIENIGIILMGLGIAAIAMSKGNQVLFSLSIIASMAHTFNHSIFKGLMFLNAGSVHFATHTKNMEELGGLMKSMPITGVLTVIGGLSISAIVPFNGFIGEWLTYQSFFMMIDSGDTLINIITILGVIVLAIAGALALGSIVKLIGISFLGRPRSIKAKNAKEVPKIMLVPKIILALFCFVLGIFPSYLVNLVTNAFTNIQVTSLNEKMSGSSMIPWYQPVSINKNGIMPLGIFILLVIVIIISLILVRIIFGKKEIRSYYTWDCGFGKLNSRMQYSATGISKPVGIVLKNIYQPRSKLKVEEGVSPYHPKSKKYIVSTELLFEKYIYSTIIRSFSKITKTIKYRVQTGSIHLYLLYIFLLVFIFLFYNRLV